MMQGSSRNRFRRFTVLVALCFAAFPTAAAEEITTFAALPTGQRVVRVYYDDPSDLRALGAYDVWESVNLGGHSDGGSRSGEACSGTGGPGGGAFVH